MTAPFDTPIIFFVFNRPEPTSKVFETIRAIRPTRLLVVGDGARSTKPGEAAKCLEVRAISTAVDWPCELQTNFSEQNLGCHPRIVSGLDWAFSLVDEAIILEDDCYPDASFYPFCGEMLARYREDFRIAAIGGTNLVQDYVGVPDSYYFSLLTSVWGWATWKSRWLLYDRRMQDWAAIRDSGAMRELFDKGTAVAFWTKIFDQTFAAGERGAWDYRWVYNTLLFDRLTIVPRVNLIRNLGFGPDATHTFSADKRRKPKLNRLEFPLNHPAGMVNSRSLVQRYQSLFENPLRRRVLRRLTPLLSRLVSRAAL